MCDRSCDSSRGSTFRHRNNIYCQEYAKSANSPESAKVAEKELFSFIDIEGWRKGPSNATSMAVFGNDDLTKVSPCFISVEYKKGTVDENKKHLDNLETLTETGDFDVEELQAATLGMQTTKARPRIACTCCASIAQVDRIS